MSSLPVAGRAEGTLILVILIVNFVKTCQVILECACECRSGSLCLSSSCLFSLYVLGPSLSATPPPLRYVRVMAPQGRGVCEASRSKSSSKRDAWGSPLTCKQPMRRGREKRDSRDKKPARGNSNKCLYLAWRGILPWRGCWFPGEVLLPRRGCLRLVSCVLTDMRTHKQYIAR